MNDDSATHAALCRWGIWYDFEVRGPKPHTDAHPWAKQIRSKWKIDSADPVDEDEMEQIHLAYLDLSRDNWAAACIIAKHYRDWRLGDRKHPQPFPNSVLRRARYEFQRHMKAAGFDRASGLD